MRLLAILTLLTIQGMSLDKEALFKSLEDLEGSTDSRITKTEVGRYCITKPFFEDAKKKLVGEREPYGLLLWKDMRDHETAQLFIMAYWRRYCPKALQDGDIRVLAAVFRKGPRGFQNPTGIKYGKRALALYYEYSKGSRSSSP